MEIEINHWNACTVKMLSKANHDRPSAIRKATEKMAITGWYDVSDC